MNKRNFFVFFERRKKSFKTWDICRFNLFHLQLLWNHYGNLNDNFCCVFCTPFFSISISLSNCYLCSVQDGEERWPRLTYFTLNFLTCLFRINVYWFIILFTHTWRVSHDTGDSIRKYISYRFERNVRLHFRLTFPAI